MGLQTMTSTTFKKSASRGEPIHMHAAGEDFFPHAHVPILDDDLAEDYFEPDGVNDFVRDFESWDPDRDC